MPPAPVIVLQALSKFYKIYPGSRERMLEAFDPRGRDRHRKFHVLKNIDLTVLEGEVVGIIGRNGCGKSTLLKIIAGLLNSSSGALTVNGSVAPVSDIGSGLNPELTGRQNIAFRVQLSAVPGVEAVERINDIVDFAELADFLDQPVKTYSSGMAARLGFAIAAFSDAQILLLDEVLAVGDLRFRRKCFDLINGHIDQGKTVLLVSHDTQAILQFCSRALVLEQGAIAAMGSPKAAIEVYERLLFEKQPLTTEPELPDSTNRVMNPDAKAVNAATAVFNNAYIQDERGQISNKLNQGGCYTFHFDIVFNSPCTDISFGAQIRLPTGFLISGANLLDHEGRKISSARTGDIIHASWSFECLLVPGGYCMRAFVTGADNAQTALVDDILLFEVEAVDKQNGGVVTLNQTVEYILQTAN